MASVSRSVSLDPQALMRPRRSIVGISAILLPFEDNPDQAGLPVVDWSAFEQHVARTATAGLIPAVNMDTGYVQAIDGATRAKVLEHTRRVLGPRRPFVAGAFVEDQPGAPFDLEGYCRASDQILKLDGVPVIFPSYGLTRQSAAGIIAAHAALGRFIHQYIAFELSPVFSPVGCIYEPSVFSGLLDVPQCIGAKHSSLSRELEWERITIRDRRRPEFRIYTGNDLAIDMVMYGSDYLLGLSTMAPDLFARRDRFWADGDPTFYTLNDQLQALGAFTFRNPVPSYRHSAAQFLRIRGWLKSDRPHPSTPRRPESDLPILRTFAEQMDVLGSKV